jgi:RimJ/RimL family protein N-acetyltransferase
MRVATIVARVKIDNQSSQKLFENAGFRLIGEQGGVLRYHAYGSQRPSVVETGDGRAVLVAGT